MTKLIQLPLAPLDPEKPVYVALNPAYIVSVHPLGDDNTHMCTSLGNFNVTYTFQQFIFLLNWAES